MEHKVLCIVFEPEGHFGKEALESLYKLMGEEVVHSAVKFKEAISALSDEDEEDLHVLWEHKMCRAVMKRIVNTPSTNKNQFLLWKRSNYAAYSGNYARKYP